VWKEAVVKGLRCAILCSELVRTVNYGLLRVGYCQLLHVLIVNMRGVIVDRNLRVVKERVLGELVEKLM
jgi:hypothetical protein